MITRVEISNFRSIEHDSIDLARPLTLIVGPNGVGKTNLLLAMRFLKNALTLGPVRAIQVAGGLDQVFRMKARRTRECTIKVSVRIEQFPTPYRLEHIFFESANLEGIGGKEVSYEFCLSYSSEKKSLEIRSEVVKEIRDFDERIIYDRSNSEHVFAKPNVSNEEISTRLFLSSIDYLFTRPAFLSTYDTQLLAYLSFEVANVSDYNLNPFFLRSSSDLLSVEDIKYDGSGMSSYLYRLQRSTTTNFFSSGFHLRRIGNQEAWKDLRSRFSSVLPFVEKLAFNEDISSTNVDLKIKEINSPRQHNAGQVSDGTLKYIALVARILSADYSLIGLEEIENCLHPKAIRELISLVNEMASKFRVQFIITSHSETVLNQCEVDSILVARREADGATVYRVPTNSDTLSAELEAGGFGLGTYWGSHDGVE